MKYSFQKLTGYPYTPDQWGKYYLCDMDTNVVYGFQTAKQAWRFTISFHKDQFVSTDRVSSLVLVLGPTTAFSFPGATSNMEETANEFNLSSDSWAWLQKSQFKNALALYHYAFDGEGFDDNWSAFNGLKAHLLLEILDYAVKYGGYTPKFWDYYDSICYTFGMK